MKDKMKQDVKLTIEEAENGIVVTCCYGDVPHEDKKYIYKTIDAAAKDIPSIFSVGEADAPDETEESMEKMKAKINSEKY